MEKAKRHPANPRISGCWKEVLHLVLAIISIALICIVIFIFIVGFRFLPPYFRLQSVQDWEIPPQSTFIDFDSTDLKDPFKICDDPGCGYYVKLIVASDLSTTDLITFYAQQPDANDFDDIRVIPTGEINNDGKLIYWIIVYINID